MASKRKPTIRAVWLGQELRKMRDEAGFNVREMSSLIGLSVGNVSKLENGIYPAPTQHVESYLRMCGIDDRRRLTDIRKICDDVTRKGWWDGYADELASELMDRIWLESRSTHIEVFEPAIIPGLLQTTEYARAVMRADQPNAGNDDIERWQEVRTTRQIIISRHEPITFQAIIDESAIRRAMTDRTAGVAQLTFLEEAAQRPNLDIRVLPSSAGFHASLGGSFEVLTLVEPYPEAGLFSTPAGDLCVEGKTIDDLKQRYARLLDESLDPKATRQFISEVIKQ